MSENFKAPRGLILVTDDLVTYHLYAKRKLDDKVFRPILKNPPLLSLCSTKIDRHSPMYRIGYECFSESICSKCRYIVTDNPEVPELDTTIYTEHREQNKLNKSVNKKGRKSTFEREKGKKEGQKNL